MESLPCCRPTPKSQESHRANLPRLLVTALPKLYRYLETSSAKPTTDPFSGHQRLSYLGSRYGRISEATTVYPQPTNT